MGNIDDLKEQEVALKDDLNSSLQLAAKEERMLVDATGYHKKVIEKMRDSFYRDAKKIKEELIEVQRKIKNLKM